MRAREVFFVLFVILCGLIINWVARHEGCSGFYLGFESDTYFDEETLSCAPYSSIEVENRFSDVKVSSWDRALLSVTLTKRVWTSNRRKAELIADQLQLRIYQEGDVYRVSTNRSELTDVTFDFETDLTLIVPLHSQVSVDNRQGEVEIRGLAGEQIVKNAYEDILASDIDGNLVIESKESNIVVEDIRGGLTVNNSDGDVTVTKLEGELHVENPYGNVEADEIGGMVSIVSKNSSILLSKVKQDIEVIAPNSRVGIREAGGSVGVETSNEPVSVEEFRGEVYVKTTNALMSLSTSAPLAAGIRAVNSNGNIHLSLPEDVSFLIEAISFGGQIISDFEDPNLLLSQEEGKSYLTGAYRRGGPKIYLETNLGDIILEILPSEGAVEEPPRVEN